jgi:hypothetical protein
VFHVDENLEQLLSFTAKEGGYMKLSIGRLLTNEVCVRDSCFRGAG